MFDRVSFFQSQSVDVYSNLALEEHLLSFAEKGVLLLYLWTNRRTVIVGRNQNLWRECRPDYLDSEYVKIARRKTGGGAVYHDEGNLNFSLICHEEDYEQKKLTAMILRALRSLGIEAEATGRNDLVLKGDGRKFSGMAFMQKDGLCLMHGTLMVNVDIDSLVKYLRVSDKKLISKGIPSVRNRVVNLSDIIPGITKEQVAASILLEAEKMSDKGVTFCKIPNVRRYERLIEEYRSPKWIRGDILPFNWKAQERFSWGEIQIMLDVEGGTITRAYIFSDVLEWEIIEKLKSRLPKVKFEKEQILMLLDEMIAEASQTEAAMLKDIATLFDEI